MVRWRRNVGRGADGGSLDLHGVVRHLVVAEGGLEQHPVGRRARQWIGRHVLCVAVRFAAVPEGLDERHDDVAVEPVGVARVEQGCEGVEVGRPREQRREVHPGHAQDGAGEVGRDGGDGSAHDPALRVAVVHERARVDEARPFAGPEGGVCGEAPRVAQQPAEEEEVEDPLL